MLGAITAAAAAASTVVGKIVTNNTGAISRAIGAVGNLAPFTGVGMIANIFNQQVEMNKKMSGMRSQIDSLQQENEALREDLADSHFHHHHYRSSVLSSLNSPRR